jgi:hypothetical protein
VVPLRADAAVRNPKDAWDVAEFLTDVGTDAARQRLSDATSVSAQAAQLAGDRATRRAAAKELVKANRTKLEGIGREVAGAERWGSLGTAFDTVALVKGGVEEGRVGVEKAVANKLLGDTAAWAGAELGAWVGMCVAGPGGAAALGLAGGLAGSLCYSKGLQKAVEKRIEDVNARAAAEQRAREERDAAFRREVAADIAKHLDEREREAARRSREEAEAGRRQRKEWEEFIAAVRAQRGSSEAGSPVSPPAPEPGPAPQASSASPPPAAAPIGPEPPPPAVQDPGPGAREVLGALLPGLIGMWNRGAGGAGPGPSPMVQAPQGRAGGPGTPRAQAPPACAGFEGEFQRLLGEQQRLMGRLQSARTEGERRTYACQLISSSERLLNLAQRARAAGCAVRGDLNQAAAQTRQMAQRFCR